MQKQNKVQVVISCECPDLKYLILQTNERRGLFWQNITGGVEKNESFLLAAIREAIEETNLESENILSIHRLKSVLTYFGQWDNDVTEQTFHIHCKNEWAVKLDPTEHQDYQWLSKNEIDPKMFRYPSNYQVFLEASHG